MAYGTAANEKAFNDLLTDIDELFLAYMVHHPGAHLQVMVHALQPAGMGLDGRQMIDDSTGIGLWRSSSKPGDSWREGMAAAQEDEADSNPNNRAARRRAARGR